VAVGDVAVAFLPQAVHNAATINKETAKVMRLATSSQTVVFMRGAMLPATAVPGGKETRSEILIESELREFRATRIGSRAVILILVFLFVTSRRYRLPLSRDNSSAGQYGWRFFIRRRPGHTDCSQFDFPELPCIM
jgi:hypothetical protein